MLSLFCDSRLSGPSTAVSASSLTSFFHIPPPTTRWYLGIQSKKDPAHVMTEVYKAMQVTAIPSTLRVTQRFDLFSYPVGNTPSFPSDEHPPHVQPTAMLALTLALTTVVSAYHYHSHSQ